MRHYQLTAPRLRIMLSISLFIIVAIAVAIASMAYGQLEQMAVDTSHATIDANASQNNLQSLQKIQQKLAQDATSVERTNNIVADSRSYQYQDQIISDLKAYASAAGLSIVNLDFSSNVSSTQTSKPATLSAPSGVKSTSVGVSLKNHVDYTAFITFVRSIEQNLTKMQISRISLSKGIGSNVVSEALTIEVYVR